jgi:hypothetical protein
MIFFFFFKLIIWNIDIHTCLLDSTFLCPHLLNIENKLQKFAFHCYTNFNYLKNSEHLIIKNKLIINNRIIQNSTINVFLGAQFLIEKVAVKKYIISYKATVCAFTLDTGLEVETIHSSYLKSIRHL